MANDELTLRDVTESDVPIFFEHQRDATANHMAAFTPKDPSDRAAYGARWNRLQADDTVRVQTILVKGIVVGHIASFDQSGKREVTYWIGRDYWGQGIATRALEEFLNQETTRPLYARAAKDNVASIRVLEKCGFAICGEEKGFANARGAEIEEYVLVKGPVGFKYAGARIAVALHEEQMRQFLETWKAAKVSGVRLPVVDDPNYESLETLLRHVFHWARTYLLWICEKLDLPEPSIDPAPEVGAIEADAGAYMEELLNAWRTPLCGVARELFVKPEYVSPWGVNYCIDAMLEHAIVHPARHKLQLEELF